MAAALPQREMILGSPLEFTIIKFCSIEDVDLIMNLWPSNLELDFRVTWCWY